MAGDPKLASDFKNHTGSSLGITEAMIETMVNSFYAKVRNDPLLGPIFRDKIGDDWDAHLAIMCDFWSSIALSTGRYKGQPMAKHLTITDLQQEHFEHWLSLFATSANNLFPREIAEFFVLRAKKIASSLMLGIAWHKGKLDF
jgi:hemoglobin